MGLGYKLGRTGGQTTETNGAIAHPTTASDADRPEWHLGHNHRLAHSAVSSQPAKPLASISKLESATGEHKHLTVKWPPVTMENELQVAALCGRSTNTDSNRYHTWLKITWPYQQHQLQVNAFFHWLGTPAAEGQRDSLPKTWRIRGF